MKTCSGCSQEKPEYEFYTDRQKTDGLTSRCRACIKTFLARRRLDPLIKARLNRAAANWAKNNKQKRKVIYKRWAAKNKDVVRAHVRQYRARKVGATGSHSALEIAALLDLQRKKCAVCRCDISDGYQVDHITPLARGGSNDRNNIQLLCGTCNRRKWALDPQVFMQRAGFLL